MNYPEKSDYETFELWEIAVLHYLDYLDMQADSLRDIAFN